MNDPDPSRTEEFVRLLSQHQRRLYLYVLALVHRPGDAEEIIQNTNLVMWREFQQFQLGTNFSAWACRIAFHQVLAWRKSRQRDRLQFSDEFIHALAQEIRDHDDIDERICVLARCMEKLPPTQRELIRLRYSEGESIETVAQTVNRTVEATYRALSRIRQSLYECVTRHMAREGSL
jgi:RNA polymerase sigma-70 factor (ECF subfamily)